MQRAHSVAVLTAVATFLLLGAGGLVTSHEAGMSVPDWPNSYGYNMFLFPPSKWIGGIFYEHTHRLWATVVGFDDDDSGRLALAQGFALMDEMARCGGVFRGGRARRPGRFARDVDMDNLGIFHGIVAQAFFALVCAIALFTSRFWHELMAREKRLSSFRAVCAAMFCMSRF